MRFSNLNQPARLHINLYLFLIPTTLQLHPLVIIFSLKNMCFRIIYSWGVNAIHLVRVISCEPVMVETESMNFSEDSMFFKLYILQGNYSLYKMNENSLYCPSFIWTCTGTDASRNYLKPCLPI